MKKYLSDKTFREEFDFLKENVPDALEFQNEVKTDVVISRRFSDYKQVVNDTTIDLNNIDVTRLPDNFYDDLFIDILVEHLAYENKANPVDELIQFANSSSLNQELVQNLVINFGSDAFSMYLPMHRFFKNPNNGWGIYLFPEVIGPFIKSIYPKYKKEIPEDALPRLFIWCVYRRELFHFHTEYFATGQEVLWKSAFYLKYREDIYSKFSLTEHWLEEALAGDSVLKSRLVKNRAGVNSKIGKKVYEETLKSMPPGYRDYNCRSYGGPENAHKRLASQIIHLNRNMPLPTNINTIKREFSYNDKKVPVYMVSGMREIKRAQ